MPEKPDQQSRTPKSHVHGLDKAGSPVAPPASHPLQPRYLAWLYSPPLQRPVLAALCAIESEIATSLRAGLDHHVAHTRLQWWREECERCAQGRPVHPLTRELVRTYGGLTVDARYVASATTRGDSGTDGDGTDVNGGSIDIHGDSSDAHRGGAVAHVGGTATPRASPLAGIMGFADAAVWDLAGATFETRRELTAYCDRWAAAMVEPIAVYAAAAGGQPDKSRWRALGAALREVELLADLAPEAHSGRLRVPLDELERVGMDPASVAKPPWPAGLATLLRERHEALRAAITEHASDLEPHEQANFRGLLVWAALARQLSWRVQRALPNAIAPRRYDALTDGWHAWRAARHALTGNFRLN
jgi:phytoene/squalene synthetase